MLITVTVNWVCSCEKSFTANAAQAKILIDLARSKSLFLMEAVSTTVRTQIDFS